MDHSLEEPLIYFTWIPVGGGFSAQLISFQAVYCLGICLGYTYAHQPWDSPRSSSRIYDMLGVNQMFVSFTRVSSINPEVDIRIELLDLVRGYPCVDIAKIIQKIHDEVQHTLSKRNGVTCLVRFGLNYQYTEYNLFAKTMHWMWERLTQKRCIIKRNDLFLSIFSQFSENADALSFRQNYLNSSIHKDTITPFDENKVKILVHIRQGDTAIISTPWHTYLPLLIHHNLSEVDNLSEIKSNLYTHVEDYVKILKYILTSFEEDSFSVVVHSDGYQAGFDKIVRNRETYKFTDEQISLLEQSATDYDQQKIINVFRDISNTQCFVGENDNNLLNLIKCALTADVIIIGTQGLMILRLLTIFGYVENPPVVILLHRQTKLMDSYEVFGLVHKHAKLIPVFLSQPNLPRIVHAIKSKF